MYWYGSTLCMECKSWFSNDRRPFLLTIIRGSLYSVNKETCPLRVTIIRLGSRVYPKCAPKKKFLWKAEKIVGIAQNVFITPKSGVGGLFDFFESWSKIFFWTHKIGIFGKIWLFEAGGSENFQKIFFSPKWGFVRRNFAFGEGFSFLSLLGPSGLKVLKSG